MPARCEADAMKKAAILLLLGLIAGQPSFADDEGLGKKAGGGIKKGGEAAGRGVEKGLDAAEKGIRKGAVATGRGLKKAGEWVEKKAHKDGGKPKEGDK